MPIELETAEQDQQDAPAGGPDLVSQYEQQQSKQQGQSVPDLVTQYEKAQASAPRTVAPHGTKTDEQYFQEATAGQRADRQQVITQAATQDTPQAYRRGGQIIDRKTGAVLSDQRTQQQKEADLFAKPLGNDYRPFPETVPFNETTSSQQDRLRQAATRDPEARAQARRLAQTVPASDAFTSGGHPELSASPLSLPVPTDLDPSRDTQTIHSERYGDMPFTYGSDPVSVTKRGVESYAGAASDVANEPLYPTGRYWVPSGFGKAAHWTLVTPKAGEKPPDGAKPEFSSSPAGLRRVREANARMVDAIGDMGALPTAVTAPFAPVKTATGLAEGYLASQGAGAIAEKMGADPETQHLVSSIGFFIPSAWSVLSGAKSGTMRLTDPEGNWRGTFAGGNIFGGKVAGGVGATPDLYTGRVKVGGTQFEVNIPRKGSASAPAEPAAKPQAQTPADEATQAMVRYMQDHGELPKPEPPAPQPPPGPDHLTPDVATTMIDMIATAPHAQRAALTTELHGNLSGWILSRGTVVNPFTGKVELAKDAQAADKLAQQWINQGVDQHDKSQVEAHRQHAQAFSRKESEPTAENVFTPEQRGEITRSNTQQQPPASAAIGLDRSTQQPTAAAAQQQPAPPDLTRPAVPTGTSLPAAGNNPALVTPPPPVKTKPIKPSIYKVGDDVPAMVTPEQIADYDKKGFVIGKDGKLAAKPEPVKPPPPNPLVKEYPDIYGPQADALRKSEVNQKIATHAEIQRYADARGLPFDHVAQELQSQGYSIHPGTQPNGSGQPEIVPPADGPIIDQKPNTPAQQASINKPPAPVKPGDIAHIGHKEPESGRPILQPTDSITQNERLALQAAPELHEALTNITAQVPGTKFTRFRPQKHVDRVQEKVGEEEKPAETVADYLAAEISADSVKAKDDLVARLRQELPVLDVEDSFLQGRKDKAGYASTNVQVQLPNHLSAEVQIVLREVQEASGLSHEYYRQGREAHNAGHTEQGDRLFNIATRINEKALEQGRARMAREAAGEPEPTTAPGERNIALSLLRSDLAAAKERLAKGDMTAVTDVHEYQQAIDREMRYAKKTPPPNAADVERAQGLIEQAGLIDRTKGAIGPKGEALVSFEHPHVGRRVGGQHIPATFTRHPSEIQSTADLFKMVKKRAEALGVTVPRDIKEALADLAPETARAVAGLIRTPQERSAHAEQQKQQQLATGDRAAGDAGQSLTGGHRGLQQSPTQRTGEGLRQHEAPGRIEADRAGNSSAQKPAYGPAGEPISGPTGRAEDVRLVDGETLPAHYRLVEADDLIPSHIATNFNKNPRYPEGVQERAYDINPQSKARVIEYAQNFQPHYVINDNPDAVNGSPIISPDGVVLGGNTRTMAIQRVYAMNEEAPYLDMLKKKAGQFGFSPEDVERMTRPVLVREVPQPKDTADARRIGSALNKTRMAALTQNERAVSTAKAVSPETLESINQMAMHIGPDATLRDVIRAKGRDLINMLVKDGALTQQELPQYLDTSKGGGITDPGKDLIEKMVRARIVDDPALLDRVPKSIFQKLDTSLGDLAYLGSRDDGFNILPVMREALALHANVVQSGQTLDDYLAGAERDMFAEPIKPEVQTLAVMLAEKAATVRRAIKQFTADARFATKDQNLMDFGTQPVSVEDSFRDAFGEKEDQDTYNGGQMFKVAMHDNTPNQKKPTVNQQQQQQQTAIVKAAQQARQQPTAGQTLTQAATARGFFNRDVLPAIKGFTGGLVQIAKMGMHVIAPRVGVPVTGVDAIMKMKGDRDKTVKYFTDAGKGITKFFDSLTPAERISYVDRIKTGQPQPSPELQQIADYHREILDHIHSAELAYDQHLPRKTNYFPVQWKEVPGAPKARGWGILKRPLEGGKSFKKQQSLPDFSSGLLKGGVPDTFNPQTMIENRIKESVMFTSGNKVVRDLVDMGLAKSVDIGGDHPEGWVTIKDPAGTIFRNPNIPVTEYFDQQVWDKLNAFAQSLGVKHTRAVKIGVDAMGVSSPGQVKTKFGSSLDTLMHEVGHQIQDKHHFIEKIVRDPRFAKELRALADLRFEGVNATAAQKAYVRSNDEKAAVVIESLLFARDRFQQVAPRVYDWITTFLKNDPKLAPLLDIRPSLVSGSRTEEIYAGGPVLGGQYWFEPNTARILENYLSRDLIRANGVGRSVMNVKNSMTAIRLGLSLFHAGIESSLAVGSQIGDGFATAWNDGVLGVSPVAFAKGLGMVATSPAAPFTAVREGGKMLRYAEDNPETRKVRQMFPQFQNPKEFINTPKGAAFLKKYPEAAEYLADLFNAGARFEMHPDTKVARVWQGLKDEAKAGNYVGTAVRIPPAFIQALQIPLFEYIIPRMKIGTFLKEYPQALADYDDLLQSDKMTRETLARKVWDSIEYRFGEMNWDNFFFDNTVKSAMQLAFRAMAWYIGNYGFGGAAFKGQALRLKDTYDWWKDAARGTNSARPSAGPAPKLDSNFARILGMLTFGAVAGYMIHRLATGHNPTQAVDYVAPQDGTVDEKGKPNRILLPIVPFKDYYMLQQNPTQYSKSKLADMWTVIPETVMNRDFQGDLISHPSDAWYKQLWDRSSHVIGEPVSVSGYQKLRDEGKSRTSALVYSQLGATKAPASSGMSKAESLAHKLADAPDVKAKMSDAQLEQYEHDRDEHRQQINSGEIEKTPQLLRDFKFLNYLDARKVMDIATSQERELLWHEYKQKQMNALRSAAKHNRDIPDALLDDDKYQ